MEDQTVCQQQETLITYLYEECEPDERARFEAHLETCARCVAELEALRGVRGTLETWVPPEMNLGVRIVGRTVRWRLARGGARRCSRRGAWLPPPSSW